MNVAEPSPVVVVSVSFRGTGLDSVERGWSLGLPDDSADDGLPEASLRLVQRWTGAGISRLSTWTVRDERPLGELLVEEAAGEVLSWAVLADLPKPQMRRLLTLVNEAEPGTVGAALEIDGTSIPGVALPALATPLGPVGGAAVRRGADTIVVIHDGSPDPGLSLRTAAANDVGRPRTG